MLEREFKKKERERFMKLGWVFIQHVAGAGTPEGFPDTVCLAPNGYHCYVEWKRSKTAKKRPLQDYWVEKLNTMHHDAFFVYPENVEDWRKIMLEKGGVL